MEEIILDISNKTLEELKKASKLPYPLYYKNVFNSILQERGLLEELNPKILCIAPDLNEEILTKTMESIKTIFSLSEDIRENIKNLKPENIEDLKKNIERNLDLIQGELDLLDNDVEDAYHQLLIDPLTKVYNKRALKQDLNTILSKGKDKNLDLVIAVIDIDNFKKVNEKYGHLIGDFVLIKVIEIVRKNIRKENYIYRYEGDKFVIVFNRSTLELAENSVKRVLYKVFNKKLKYKDNLIHVSLSAGITQHKRGDNFETIIKRVLEALTLAKLEKNSYKIKD